MAFNALGHLAQSRGSTGAHSTHDSGDIRHCRVHSARLLPEFSCAKPSTIFANASNLSRSNSGVAGGAADFLRGFGEDFSTDLLEGDGVDFSTELLDGGGVDFSSDLLDGLRVDFSSALLDGLRLDFSTDLLDCFEVDFSTTLLESFGVDFSTDLLEGGGGEGDSLEEDFLEALLDDLEEDVELEDGDGAAGRLAASLSLASSSSSS